MVKTGQPKKKGETLGRKEVEHYTKGAQAVLHLFEKMLNNVGLDLSSQTQLKLFREALATLRRLHELSPARREALTEIAPKLKTP